MRKRRRHFAGDAGAHGRIHESAVIAARHDLDDRVAAEFLERLPEQARRALQVERVVRPHVDVHLAGQLRTKLGPVLLEDQANVVAPPTIGHLRIDRPALADSRSLHGWPSVPLGLNTASKE